MLTAAGGRGRAARGVSLLEMLLVLGLMAVVAQGAYTMAAAAAADAVVRRTVDGIVMVDEAVYAYRIDNPGTWPGTMAALSPYLGTAGAVTNGVGLGYTLTPRTTSLAIGTTMLDAGQARAVAAAFPLTASYDAATFGVEFEIPIPGHESSHAALLRRDGTAPMMGDLDMDGNAVVMGGGNIQLGGGDVELGGGDVVGVGTAEAEVLVFTTTVAVGGSCPANGVGVTASGEIATCVGGVWSAGACEVTGGRALRAGTDHWLIVETTCGDLAGIQFEGSNA